MKTLRNHWYQIGIGLALASILALIIWHNQLSSFRILLGISLVTLFLHQFEEYQFPGGFPKMINTAMFKSKQPDRFPLNSNTAMIINVYLGWLLYALAFIFAEHAVWLAIASIMISVGNFVAHTFMFNIKGKTLYNPGMATSIVLFLPISIYFFIYLAQHNLIHPASLIVGLILGIILNYFGVIRSITLLANKNTSFVFSK